MNMNIEDQRAVEKAAGPAVSPCAAFGPGTQSCHAGVMPLQDGASQLSQFNLLKPVKGCSSQFADKVPCIPPSTQCAGFTLQHPNGPHLQNGASQLSLLKPVKGCLSQFADKVHSLAPREVQPVVVPDTSSPQCHQIPPPDTSSPASRNGCRLLARDCCQKPRQAKPHPEFLRQAHVRLRRRNARTGRRRLGMQPLSRSRHHLSNYT